MSLGQELINFLDVYKRQGPVCEIQLELAKIIHEPFRDLRNSRLFFQIFMKLLLFHLSSGLKKEASFMKHRPDFQDVYKRQQCIILGKEEI